MIPTDAVIHMVYITIISVLLYQLVSQKSAWHSDTTLVAQQEEDQSTSESSSTSDEYRMMMQEGSSIWCWGSNHTTRMCRFTNLCYSTKQDSFVFFRSENSVIVGVPADRFNPALLDLSSITNHNAQYFNYIEVPSSMTEELLVNFEIIQEPMLIFNRFHADNIMHVFHDDLLPLYTTIRMLQDDRTAGMKIMFADAYDNSSYPELYEYFTNYPIISRYELKQKGSEFFCFANAFVGLSKHSTWYDYGFYQPQAPLPHISITGEDIRQFTRYLRSKMNQQIQESDDLILLISRRDTRLILNEMELSLSLVSHLKKKVLSVSLESHSVGEIINMFSRASLVIGMHGSLMIFAMFLPPSAIMLELFPYGVNPDQYTPYRTLAEIQSMDLVYRSWRNIHAGKSRTHPARSPELGGIEHLLEHTQKRIQNSVEVPPHLCCSDPEWLFRIFQDTDVTIEEILDLVDSALEERKKIQNHPHLSISPPSEVRNLQCINPCEVDEENCIASYKCDWNPPWNIFSQALVVKYELWIQYAAEDVYTSHVVKETTLSWTPKQSGTQYLWIRAALDNINGPFVFRKLE